MYSHSRSSEFIDIRDVKLDGKLENQNGDELSTNVDQNL